MIIYKFIKNLIIYIKHRSILEKIYKEENLKQNLSKLLGANVREDWIGRLYVIINPSVQKGVNEEILEYGVNGLTNKSFVEKWIMDRLIAADAYIKNHNLFEVLTYNIEQVDNYGNFLFTTTPIAWFEFWKWTKMFILELLIITVIITTLLIIF